MQIQALCNGTTDAVANSLSSPAFSDSALTTVIGNTFNVQDVLMRPAEYCVLNALRGPSSQPGVMGVQVCLTGVNRNGRASKKLHESLKVLVQVVKEAMLNGLLPGQRCQMFCVVELDAEIETAPDSGVYSRYLESAPVWVVRADTED